MVFTASKHWELAGITSGGDGCASEKAGIYTKIAAFVPFIQTVINSTLSKFSVSICACQCPDRSVQEFSHTKENSTEACITACGAIVLYGCESSNASDCNSTSCPDSTSSFHSDNNIYRAIYIWLNGDRCEGLFKNEKMQGNGTCQYANEGSYTGDWVDGKRMGHGATTWSNGDRYEGHYENDIRTGYGVYSWQNEDRYEMGCSEIFCDRYSRCRLIIVYEVDAMSE